MLDLEKVRAAAKARGYEEVQFNESSRVIGFRRADERVNVYYTTGTVGTALAHPRKGKTQLFRRNCSMERLLKIFDDPRTHTGVACVPTFISCRHSVLCLRTSLPVTRQRRRFGPI